MLVMLDYEEIASNKMRRWSVRVKRQRRWLWGLILAMEREAQWSMMPTRREQGDHGMRRQQSAQCSKRWIICNVLEESQRVLWQRVGTQELGVLELRRMAFQKH
jgi:hypothetical protein